METSQPVDEAPDDQGVSPVDQDRFATGRIVATPGALWALEVASVTPETLLARHRRGDWGELDEHDKQDNERGLTEGTRLLSVYSRLPGGVTIWIITEADRSTTTLLTPDEY